MSDSFMTGPTVSQGSIGGGLISAINLDYSITRFFLDSPNEVFYHDIKLAPLIYQDALGKFSASRMDAQAGNDRIEACMETKLLDLHQDKSCYILIGSKKVTEEISEEFKLEGHEKYEIRQATHLYSDMPTHVELYWAKEARNVERMFKRQLETVEGSLQIVLC